MTPYVVRTIYVVLLSLGWCWNTCAQIPARAVRFQVGHSFVGESLPTMQVYDLWLMSLGGGMKLVDVGPHLRINGVADVQFGAASSIHSGKQDFDLALNISTEFLWQFHKAVGFRATIGSGPGYQSSDTGVQARGYVFSNNFSAGLRFSLAQERVVLVPQVRFRHMSNAGLKLPNKGIDNFLFLVGIEVPLDKDISGKALSLTSAIR